MNLQAVPTPPRPRATAEDIARLREIATPVRRAARFLIEANRTSLSQGDLEAFGKLAVWRSLPRFDPSRAGFERWAFYQALHAMIDASRDAQRKSALEAAIQRGAQGRILEDESPAESDFERDTPETDLGRLQARTHQVAFSAFAQASLDALDAGAVAERTLVAMEVVRAVHEEVARLSDEQRADLEMRFWNDMEIKERAARLGLSERTLRRRWTETRDLFEARLRARGIVGIPEGFGEAADRLALGGKKPR